MKKSTLLPMIAVIILSLAVLSSCGGSKKEDQAANTEETAVEEEQAVVAETEEVPNMKLGEQIYKDKCIVCHMADGQGVPGAFPPLSKSDYLLKDKVRAAIQVLKGSHKAMIVNGKTYNGKMPPQVLSTEEAVAVINYALNNFENKAGTVSIDEVNYRLEDEKEVDDIPFNTKKIADSLR